MWLFSRIWKSGSSSSGYAPEFTILASKIPKKNDCLISLPKLFSVPLPPKNYK